MRARTVFGRCVVALLAFVFSLLTVGCVGNDKDAIEYVNEKMVYADDEVCVERYLLYEEDGEYERYIAGMYYGQELPGIYFGTLFETGTYAVDTSKTSKNITFSPKKQYDFDTKQLKYLGLDNENRIPYTGTLTDTTLTLTYRVWYWEGISYHHGEIPIVYKRK